MKTRTLLAPLFLLVGCAANHAQTRPAPYRSLPSLTKLQRDVRRLGAATVIGRIAANPLLPAQLCDQVETVTHDWVGFGVAQEWLEVVVALGDESDESLSECMATALTDALAHEPSSVLAAIRKSGKKAELLEHVCRNPDTRVSDHWSGFGWKEQTLLLLHDVPDELALERAECLAALQRPNDSD